MEIPIVALAVVTVANFIMSLYLRGWVHQLVKGDLLTMEQTLKLAEAIMKHDIRIQKLEGSTEGSYGEQ